MDIKVQLITAEQTHPLRHKVLRPNQPLHACIYPDDDKSTSKHFGAYFKDQIVGIISIYQLKDDWRIRGMAVEESARGKGIAAKLLQTAIDYIHEAEHAKTIWCNARTPAVGLYEKFGFETEGDKFDIEGIGPHYLMIRK